MLHTNENILNTAIIGLIDREKLQAVMSLIPYKKVVYTQAIGKSR